MVMLLRLTVLQRRSLHLVVLQNHNRTNPNSVELLPLLEKVTKIAALGVEFSLLLDSSKILQRCSSLRLTGVQLTKRMVKRSRLLLKDLVTLIKVPIDHSARRASSHNLVDNQLLEASQSLSSQRLAVVLFDPLVRTQSSEVQLHPLLFLEVVVSKLLKARHLYKKQNLFSVKASILRAHSPPKRLNMSQMHQA